MAESKVKVAVRVRPMDQRETDRKAECVVYMEGNQTVVKFSSPTFDGHCPAQKEFHFDHCFWSVNDEGLAKYASQEDVFTTLGEDILDNTFGGFNSCIFAYGQTGSGKTFSIMGTDDQPGLVPRICSALFSRDVSHLTSLQVEVTYLEIYNEKVQDLLCPTIDFKALKVREHKFLGPYVEGLSHHAVKNAEDIKSLILEGNKCRKIINTKMNEHSSRSHAIFTLTVTQTFHKENTMKELLSKVSLVDLAGSERTSITGATGEALKQSSNINKSLSSLGLVINSLAELSEGRRRSSYVNYRDSVLSWLLKNNLGGNSKTIMLATISPASINYQETLSTLKYADNAKRIVNKPRVNEDLNARTIAELAKEVKALSKRLQQAKAKYKEDLQARLNESETLLRELKLSWEEKLQKTEISALERQKELQRLGIMVEHSGISVNEDKCYLLRLSIDNKQNELILYYLGENTKIGAGDFQDIKITGPGIELEHCVIDNLQDGNIILTPNHNAETFVNSSRVNKGVMLYHEDKIMLGNKASFMLHKPSAKSKIAPESPDMVHDDPGNQPEEGSKQGNESVKSTFLESSVGVLPLMEPLEKKAANYIRRSREQIMNILQKDFDTFLDEVDSQNIITQDEYFKVENMETDMKKKARTLVNQILQKDESTCRAFLQCLQLNPKKENSPEPEVKKIHSEESEKGTSVKVKKNSPEPEVKKSPNDESEKVTSDKEHPSRTSHHRKRRQRVKKRAVPEKSAEDWKGAMTAAREKENSPEEEMKKIHSEESEKVQTEKDKRTCFQDLLKKIEFQSNLTSKLTLKNVLDIGAECFTPAFTSRENVVWNFIRKLMSLHEEARNISTMRSRAEMGRDEGFMLDVDSDLSDAIHPLDLQCAIFHCSDHFLQQEMISKMSMCQFSVPLLLPAIDSPDYTFMLWAMRGIVKKWRPQFLAESKGFREEHLVNIPMPTFSFVRLGRCRLSKSKILNQVLSSTQHCQDIFVHRDMEGGNVERTLSLGLVEISWYFPAGKGIFAEPVAVTNLRGALESNLKPFSFLAEISSVVVVFMETISKSHCELLLRYKNSKTKYLFIIVPEEQKSKAEREEMIKSVMTMSERKEDNVLVITKTTNEATIVKKIRSALLKLQKKNANNLSIENMVHTATEQEICVDEHNAECQAAKEQAMKITPEIWDVVQYKGKTMTLQAQLLKDLSKLEKECCQMKKQGNRNGEEYKSELRRKCDEIRSKQWKCEIPEGIDHFIKGIETNNRSEKLYFLSWLKYSLDLAARKTLTSLQQEYKEKYSQANESKELKEIDQKISDSSLGIEHFLREVSQLYEVWHIMGKKKYLHKERINLPESGANLLLDGFPLELINGDASRIPVQWVTDVLNIVNTKTGGQSRIRVITVLGVQSTGKSTLLNTMFGLQFPVASGRCTRGAFMTLIKVKKNLSKEIGCEFLLVIDTEGLKAPELDSLEDSYEHDNELATLVVGLSDITIVNMAMENTAEMKDILQIVVHSFLRMKEIGKKPNCQFVHQNVSDVSAPVMNMRDRNKLLEQLNEMTRTVATMEKKPQYKVFNDVMGYDSEHHHWYIPSLWQGVPPMAPVSAGYSESVAEIKRNLLKLIKESQTKPQTIPEFVRWMEDLWNAVKHENFIFSFRNSLVASAYNKLSMHYSELEWKFSKLIHEWFTNTETVIKNQSAETLENKGKECCIKLESLISAEQNKLITWVEDYFQHETDCVYLIKYKEDFKISAKRLGENLRQSSYEKYNNAIQIQKQQLNIKKVQMQYIEKIEQKVSSLVEECRKKRHQLDEENMEKEFENMWQHTVEELKVKPLVAHDVEKDMLLELTKTMRDKGSAVNERLNKTQHLPKPNEKSGGGKKKGWTAYFKSFFSRETGIEKRDSFFEFILRKCCKYSEEQAGRDVDYDDTYCKHLLNIIDDDLKEKLNISSEVELDIKLNILGHAVEDFQKMHNNFVKKNDPYLQLKTLKSEYFNTFRNVFQEKNESQNLARRIYENCLKPAVIDYTIRNLGIEIVDDIMNSKGSKTYTSRTFFQYTVLRNLLERNIFEKYAEYSGNYKEFVKNWILKYIKIKYKNFSSIQNNILPRITKKIETLLINPDMWNQSMNVEDVFYCFQEELSSDLVFPQEKVKAILFQNSANTKEFIKNLKNFMTDIKEEIISESECQGVEAILSRVTVKPQDVLFKKVFGCGNQCPFCKVPCEAGGEEHKEHFASVHRPDGLGRYRWTLTSILSHDICTTSVCGNTSFTNKDAQFHPFKRYKEIYPDWKIQPDPSIEASDYWKFVLKEFNDQFAEEYNAKPAKHPEEWNNLTKEMAIESLKKTFNM
ncbi:interferon-induced very large GTPase 1-like isoform X2 [Phyllobates terribilis]|uniref:interferon-induced very large GTPase 1-like isoform X2 n=1 Tax=Phyllobates terribilis TaxID=111132 RepID=UPI003CCAC21F